MHLSIFVYFSPNKRSNSERSSFRSYSAPAKERNIYGHTHMYIYIFIYIYTYTHIYIYLYTHGYVYHGLFLTQHALKLGTQFFVFFFRTGEINKHVCTHTHIYIRINIYMIPYPPRAQTQSAVLRVLLPHWRVPPPSFIYIHTHTYIYLYTFRIHIYHSLFLTQQALKLGTQFFAFCFRTSKCRLHLISDHAARGVFSLSPRLPTG